MDVQTDAGAGGETMHSSISFAQWNARGGESTISSKGKGIAKGGKSNDSFYDRGSIFLSEMVSE